MSVIDLRLLQSFGLCRINNFEVRVESDPRGMATTSTPLSNISILSRYRASNCEGIASLPFHLPLAESVNRVIKALEVYGTVLIKAPPGSGKTSFIVRILSYLPSTSPPPL